MVLSKGSKRSWSASAHFLQSMLDNWLSPTVSVTLSPQCICSVERSLHTIHDHLRSFYNFQLAFVLSFRFNHILHIFLCSWRFLGSEGQIALVDQLRTLRT
jgi:hypothetical protein